MAFTSFLKMARPPWVEFALTSHTPRPVGIVEGHAEEEVVFAGSHPSRSLCCTMLVVCADVGRGASTSNLRVTVDNHEGQTRVALAMGIVCHSCRV
jgi:hypothetical protein